LLRNATVLALIAELEAKVSEAVELRASDVRRSLARALMFDPRKLLDANGERKRLQDLDDDTAMALTEVTIDGVKYRIDRTAARDQAMKHHGLYERDNLQKNEPRNMTDEELEAAILREREALDAIEKAQVSSRKLAKAHSQK